MSQVAASTLLTALNNGFSEGYFVLELMEYGRDMPYKAVISQVLRYLTYQCHRRVAVNGHCFGPEKVIVTVDFLDTVKPQEEEGGVKDILIGWFRCSLSCMG